MANKGRHAALVALRKADHLFDLFPLLLALRGVGCSPLLLTVAHVLRIVQYRAFVDPQFLQILSKSLPRLPCPAKSFLIAVPPGDSKTFDRATQPGVVSAKKKSWVCRSA